MKTTSILIFLLTDLVCRRPMRTFTGEGTTYATQ
jgi:hypothetical protein